VEIRAGRLEKWIKLPATLYSASAALEIVRTVGKTEGAKLLDVPVEELEQWVFDGVPPSADALVREVLSALKAKERQVLSGEERESLPYRTVRKINPWQIKFPDPDMT